MTFPWLGPLGITFALPTKYHIWFGNPLRFEGDSHDEDEVIGRKVNRVKEAIRGLIDEGLAQRRGVFR